jgi:rare lipoprotein A
MAGAGCGRSRPATASVPPAPPATGAPPTAAGPESQPAPSTASPIEPSPYNELGIASWYGLPFDGRRASDGEIFDMRQLVAAHRTLPFGSIVRVTNLSNGRQIEVRIIDRGPFVGGRVIDLSQAAARAIDMLGPGTAPVRLDLISSPTPLAGQFAVQIGAFGRRENAERLRARLLARYPVIVFQEYDAPAGHLYRVLVGRLASQQAAQEEAAQLSRVDAVSGFVVRIDSVQ